MYTAIKSHYSDGKRRSTGDIFDITDSDLAKSLIAQKCIREVIEMKKKGGKKKGC